MQIKMFWQDNCPNCGPAKDIVKQFKDKIDINYLNINDIDGMSEAAFHAVMSTPSILIVDDDEKELKSWRAEVPTYNDITEILSTLC